MINYMTILPFILLYLSLYVLFFFWYLSLSLTLTLFSYHVHQYHCILSPFNYETFLSLHHFLHTFSLSNSYPYFLFFTPSYSIFFLPQRASLSVPISSSLSLFYILLLPASYFHLCPSSSISICITYSGVWEKHPYDWTSCLSLTLVCRYGPRNTGGLIGG